ncbi:MAG: hypothetical protein RBS28_11655 [Rhodocyclaceae bacterium]|jgi:hypothetical protein|nr:hypothetical protein [Rhodocyclaceae bacterium]
MLPLTNSFRLRFAGPLAMLVAAALCIATYWSGLQGDFFFDDEPNILQLEPLRLDHLSFDGVGKVLSSGISGPLGRPVAQLSFALNHYFSGGFDPFAFKAVNLAVHILTGFLVYLLSVRLVAAGQPQAERGAIRITAAVVAAVWLLHPIQLTTVLYAVQRMNGLSALFLLAAVLLHVQGREKPGGTVRLLLAWMVCWPLSMLSKENGLLFPVFVLAWELILHRHQRGRLDAFGRWLAICAGLAIGGSAAYALLPAGQWLWAGYEFRSFTLAERLLTEGRVLWFYLGLIVWPRLEALGLHHDDFIPSAGMFTPWMTLPSWLAIAGLLWFAWRMRIAAPLLSFGIAWFFAGHLLESTFLPLELVHEHRNYVPLLGILLALATPLLMSLEATGVRKTLGVTLAAVAVGYGGLITGLRAHQFGEEVRRSQIEAQHHPDSPRAHYEAGRAVAQLPAAADPGSPAFYIARTHFERAGRIDPGFRLGWLGLMQLYCRAGRPLDREWMEVLKFSLRELPLGPGDQSLLFNLKEMAIAGTVCLVRQDVESLFAAAGANTRLALPVRARFHSWLADYLVLGARDPVAAKTELDRSLGIAPYNRSNRLKRAQLAFLLEEYAEARHMLSELGEEGFGVAERSIYAQLAACLNAAEPSTTCVAK